MATPFLTLAAERGVDWPHRSARLELRPFTPADAPALWEYWRLESTTLWLGRLFDTPEALEARKSATGSTLVVTLPNGEIIGDVSVDVRDAWAQAEATERARDQLASLGWVLSPHHQGRGYGREAVAAVIDLVLGPCGIRRVEAGCFAENEPSWRLMERLGMRREAHSIKESLHRDLGWRDGYLYALLAEEWAERTGA